MGMATMGWQKNKERGKERDTQKHKHTRTRDAATHNNAHECESSSLAVRPPDRIRPDPDISNFGDFEDLIDRSSFIVVLCLPCPAIY